MKLTVQRPSTIDIPEINELILTSKKSWGYSDDLMETWKPKLIVSKASLEEREFWLVRNEQGVAISVYSISHELPDSYELEDFWVSPSVKSLGYGRKMFSHLKQTLNEHNAQKLTIVSDPNAEGFYRAMGAIKVGTCASEPKGRVLPVMELCL